MTKKLRIAIAQINPVMGDFAKNLQKHLIACKDAKEKLQADLIIFPELSLTGYPPEDLLLRPAFIEKTQQTLQQLISQVNDIYCLVGHPYRSPMGLHNGCTLFYNQKILARYAKRQLPNYAVFDENRYFYPGQICSVVPIQGVMVGLTICEDAWIALPIQQCVAQSARLIITINASPFESEKHEERAALLAERATYNNVPIVYVNCVGGQDELVFDGGSMVVDETGKISVLADFFKEKLLPVDITVTNTQTAINGNHATIPTKLPRIYDALVLAVRDYIEKNHFPGVLVGASGGIDSALTVTIAYDALGKERVKAITLPSRYTSQNSLADVKALTKNLQIPLITFSIEEVYSQFLQTLTFSENPDVTAQNIQARCRAIILMALSNKEGLLLLNTGNRSELAVGYCTLYGDMAGGFAVLKDIPKTMVYELAHFRNTLSPVIPEYTLTRTPTAELAPNQKDEDTIPPYPILDKILDNYLNQGKSVKDIIAQGFDEQLVKKIVNLIYQMEYKRKQAALGPRINHKSFGKDWRYPVTDRFRE